MKLLALLFLIPMYGFTETIKFDCIVQDPDYPIPLSIKIRDIHNVSTVYDDMMGDDECELIQSLKDTYQYECENDYLFSIPNNFQEVYDDFESFTGNFIKRNGKSYDLECSSKPL
ncbi:MAG: hypothetical protein H6621_13190 [Halobacteriovoraceae bacterium]|nr:hypothetical protein [Halobacteriovoraceae bacterium]